MGNRLRLVKRHRFRVTHAAAVRSRIARLILGEPGDANALGGVTLHPHQRSAVDRLLTAIDRLNGALLCDEVGMGKTYVALTIARNFGRCLIVTPAALVPMWRDALRRTSSDAAMMTFEALSRADALEQRTKRRAEIQRAAFDFVIVDEAHHVRNPRTNRFFALEALVRGARVLMLTATPIHNKRNELVALFSLFLGSRARALTSAELALCVVRREHRQIGQSLRVPTVMPTVYHQLPDDPALVEQLMDLPPPVPFRDGGVARALVGRGLVHLWASSEAALHEAIKRRIARASALSASLEAGTYPTARELETWVYGEGSLQLAFAELLSAPTGSHRDLLAAVKAHLTALQAIGGRFSAISQVDHRRIEIVADIRSSHGASRTIAFSQYAATVSMLFRGLVRGGRVAMLTSHGARVAGGALTRAEAISRFAPLATGSPPPAPAEIIEQLLTTDLLSEGVNLQDADTVVHLDLPWTTARLEQRVGRVARLGSRHSHVAVHLLRPPPSAEKLLAGESIVRHKWRLARSSVGTSSLTPAFDSTSVTREENDHSTAAPVPERVEQLRAILERWLATNDRNQPAPTDDGVDDTIVATVQAPLSGFIAAVSGGDSPRLLIGLEDRISAEILTQIELCGHAGSREIETDLDAAERAVELVHDWARREQASAAAGLTSSTALRRREITSRIDASIDSAPPHLRALRMIAAQRARAIATTPQCAVVERELNALFQSQLSDDEWLQAVAALEATAGRLNETTDPLRIHAILILENRTTARRSPSPCAAESP